MKSKTLVFTVINDLTYDRRMQRICRSLALNGYDILLIGRVLNSSLPLNKEPYKQKRIKCIFNTGKLFYLEYNLRLLFFLLFQKYDAICSIDTDTLSACGISARLKNKKLVFDAHEFFTQVPEVINRPFVKKVWNLIESVFIPRTHLRYTVSESIANAFEKKFGKPFYVIQNVPLLQKSIINENKNEQYLIYQGALNEGRGLEAFINAIPEINDKLMLYIAGEGDLSLKLRSLVKKNKLDDRVFFLGLIHPEKLTPLMQNAFAGYNLLENKGLSYYWSLNNKFFDYIHSGIPVLAPPFPEFLKIIEKYEVGPTLEPDSKRIAEVINKMFDDPLLYKKYKNNCLNAKADFNWDSESLKLIDLYDQLFK